MAETSFLLKKFEKAGTIYALFSPTTKLPYIECDEETYEDCAFLFTSQEEVLKYTEPYAKKKILLGGAQLKDKDIKPFLMSLYCYGVNAVRYIDGDNVIKEELANVVESPDLEMMRNAKPPRANPELQLTGIYFMQELRRSVERDIEEKKHLKELEEEMAVNMMRSNWIVCADVTDVEEGMSKEEASKKMKLPYVKTKNGDVFQPVFSDFTECQKFNQENKGAKLRLMTVKFDDVAKYIMRDAKGICFNPKGFSLFLTLDQLEQLKKQYGE